MTKLEALAKHLDVEVDDISEEHDDNTFSVGRDEYLVLTDGEADEKAKEYILDSVWAFNASFLAAHAREGVDEEVIKSIQDNGKCESNNKVLTALIDDLDHFVDDAIGSDGRAHFLNTYDGEEHEVNWTDSGGNSHAYYIYRTN